MSPRVVLIGLPAAGKSTVGRALARHLGIPFADSDDLVVAAAGRSIPELFADGEATFRAIEATTIVAALTDADRVLALGGGAVTNDSVRQALLACGAPVVRLYADQRTLLSRVRSGGRRPLLAGDPEARLAELAAAREPMYDEVADASVLTAGRGVADVVAEITQLLGTPTPGRPARG